MVEEEMGDKTTETIVTQENVAVTVMGGGMEGGRGFGMEVEEEEEEEAGMIVIIEGEEEGGEEA